MSRLSPWLALAALTSGCAHEPPQKPKEEGVLRGSVTLEERTTSKAGYVGYGFPRKEGWGQDGTWSCDEPNTTIDIKASHIYIYTTVTDPIEGQLVRRCTVAFANTAPMRIELEVYPPKPALIKKRQQAP